MDLGLKGKTALITAASKGIGKAVAESLAAEGCEIAICSRTKDDLISAANEIKEKYKTEPFWCVCDLNKEKDIELAVEVVNKQFGKIDILVNNCGGPIPGYLRDLNFKDWTSAFEQVLMSVVKFSSLIVPEMILREWGRIINITSVSVKQPIDNLMLSNSLRSGVIGFAKTLSNEVAKFNITVNNIAPGYTLTNRLYDLAVHRAKVSGISHEEILSDMSKAIPMNRLGRPEEIASAVSFLASQQASYITGNTLVIDGGFVKGL
ncbi:MAG: 3-oxoacyl-ACP reductase [Ignavibacteria bacterium CG2_30_36_16]|nr:SDR family oxidoreductase [Ignavibacteria bacterium]OIP61922.1 MAG: 3-oxoacyl-ACP reductase [Ignavibacteria bacterium CG2_30_36_16]